VFPFLKLAVKLCTKMCDVSTYYANIDPITTPIETIAELISNHNVISYTPGCWEAIKEIDEDPDNVNNVVLIYSRRSEPKSTSGLSTGWNREHVWPRSYGVGDNGPDYSDLHHLFPSDVQVNAARSSKILGECTASNCVSPAHSEAASDTSSNSYIFTPPISVKGDLARALMYMALRYDGTDANTENLTMSECPCRYTFTSPGKLSTLLEWHEQDPVDDAERARTDRVCSYQGNRNPFVDMPSLADRIYGDVSIPSSCPFCQEAAQDGDDTTESPSNSDDDGGTLMMKYGAICGGVIVVLIALVISYWVCCRTKK